MKNVKISTFSKLKCHTGSLRNKKSPIYIVNIISFEVLEENHRLMTLSTAPKQNNKFYICKYVMTA